MPNGFHGPQAQWEKLESPLRTLDGELRAFAELHGLALSSNNKGWPDRSIVWGSPIRRLIQIYLADDQRVTYSFWLCASEDRGDSRYWRRELLKDSVLIGEIAKDLPALLEHGREMLEGWTSETLEFATTLSPVP
jgi:hypothetical protein